MDLSLALPNHTTPSYTVKRVVKPRKDSTVWDFRVITGNSKDLYVVKRCGKAVKRVKPWSMRGE
jgi:hypothetical protein